MGVRSLFTKIKKKQLSNNNSSTDSAPASSRTSSAGSRARIEEELEQVFKKFDANGDGKISSSELGSMMSSLGHDASEKELNNMIKEVDSDGDGFIDFAEFIALNTKDIDSDEVMENLKDAFSVFDKDKNGFISVEELQNVLKSLGEESSLEDCKKMISGIDSDGDGSINFQEFKVMMTMSSRFGANYHI